MTAPRAWSLHSELATIEQSIRGAELALEGIEGDVGDATAREVARCAAAHLTLVNLRLREIGRVLRGEVDAAKLYAPHNAAPVDGDEDTHDVLFPPRSSKRR